MRNATVMRFGEADAIARVQSKSGRWYRKLAKGPEEFLSANAHDEQGKLVRFDSDTLVVVELPRDPTPFRRSPFQRAIDAKYDRQVREAQKETP